MDFLNPNAKYELLANNVPRVYGATGGLLQNSPIVCGGATPRINLPQWFLNILPLSIYQNRFNFSQDCVAIGKPEMKMIEKRSYAASVALDQNTLWIVGGYNGRNELSSTEFIKLGQRSSRGVFEGPDLPFTIYNHSMIQFDKKSIYIIGGYQNGSLSKKTWIVNPKNGFEIKEGPSLNKARFGHGCAKMTLNGRTILVVAGGFGAMDSVEILDPQGNNIWTPGMFWKSIPVELC